LFRRVAQKEHQMPDLQDTLDVSVLTARIVSLIDSGRTGAARPLLVALRRIAPPSPVLSVLAARLAMREGRLDVAQAELDAAVTATPEHAVLRKCRAELRQEIGDKAGAAADAAEAVILDRQDPSAKALLGVLLLELGRATDAVTCLGEAVAENSAHPAFREGLAVAQQAAGHADAAVATLAEGIAATPGSAALRNAAVLLAVRQRDFDGALRLAEQACSDGIVDACLLGLKGHALSSLGRHAEAADAYAEALKFGPDDAYVRHLVAASGKLPAGVRAHIDYVRTVFDGYADRFDEHLISLGYRVPGLFHGALLEHPVIQSGERLGPVLDLGCGTGLAAVALSDLPIGPYTGIDVSPQMLAQAAGKQLYKELREIDLVQTLAEDTTRWPLMLAADVLCYCGDLQDLLDCVYQRLDAKGWFVCSLEELLPDKDGALPGNGDWALRRQGRYAHALHYVERVAREVGFAGRCGSPKLCALQIESLMLKRHTTGHWQSTHAASPHCWALPVYCSCGARVRRQAISPCAAAALLQISLRPGMFWA
jgi:predicted TPR repeat methyltransferase